MPLSPTSSTSRHPDESQPAPATRRTLISWPEYMACAAKELATVRGDSVSGLIRSAVRRELEGAGVQIPG